MRLLLIVLVATVAVACGKSGDEPKSKPTAETTPKITRRPHPPADDLTKVPRKPGDHPMKKLTMKLPDGWSSSYYESRRAHTVMATLPEHTAVEMLVMLLPAEYSPRLDDYVEAIVGTESIDQYETITEKKALADGFVVRGKRPHAAYELSMSRARRVGGAWLYCDGSFPDEATVDAALAVCDSAAFPGNKARLPAEDRQLYLPRSGTPGVRVRWLWNETKPMIFADSRDKLAAAQMTERSEQILAVWKQLETELGTEGVLGEAFAAITETIGAVYDGDHKGLIKRVRKVEAGLTNIE